MDMRYGESESAKYKFDLMAVQEVRWNNGSSLLQMLLWLATTQGIRPSK